MANPALPRVAILGNCVAERLQGMLPCCPSLRSRLQIARLPVVHTQKTEQEWCNTAKAALNCDIIFTQPLFRYGPCNTAELQAALRPRQRLVVFSSPKFTGYFPDLVTLDYENNYRLKPILDWDSSIIFSCFVKGVSIFEVEKIYLNHALFHERNMRLWLAKAFERYALREKNVEMQTGVYVIRNATKKKLFHSLRHPVDGMLRMMLEELAGQLGLPAPPEEFAVDGFAFNQWPVITRHHSLFGFPDQARFIIGGKRISIEDAAMAYYNFYEFNPQIVEANLGQTIDI